MQASVEVQLEFAKFFNVDLFQRGFYQLRCYAKFNPRVMFTAEISQRSKGRTNDTFHTVNGNIARTKIFQILYKREDVDINDVFIFKLDFLADILKVEDMFREVDMQFVIEMWFAEEDVRTDQLDKFQLLCQRCLKLNFDPLKGLHGNISILFDYFHLSALILSIHASLVAFKHPTPLRCNNLPSSSSSSKQSKQSLSSSQPFTNSLDLTGLDLALFGPPIPPNSSNKNIMQAQKLRKLIGCQKHHHLCRYLLSAYESIQLSFELLVSTCLPTNQQIKLEHVDCVTKLEELVLKCKNLSEMSEAEEEDVLQVVNSDLMNLNTQLSLIWCQYLELVTFNQAINRHLAKENHSQRVKRFAEGFFVREYSKAEALTCYDVGHHRHCDISAKVRLSEYFRLVPPLLIECLETDGDHVTLPIIFEDVYSTIVLPQNSMATPAPASSSEFGSTKRNSVKAAPNRWAQRNNSIKNTSARLIAATSLTDEEVVRNSLTSVVWTTDASLVASTTNHKPHGFDSNNFRRDRSSNSIGSQDSDVQGGGKKKRLSKFRPESLLLIGSGSLGGGVGWQQQQMTGTGQSQKGIQIACDAPDCQLVGYKKMDANHELAPPTIGLGTLSKTSDSSSCSSADSFSSIKKGFRKDGDSEILKNGNISNEQAIEHKKYRNNKNNANDDNNGINVINNDNNNGTSVINNDDHTNYNIINNNDINQITISSQPAVSLSSPITETTSSYISPSIHHQKTSSFLFNASSLPALNKDEDGDVTLQILNDSCLLVIGAGGGSLPELVGGKKEVGSDASSLSRSDNPEGIICNDEMFSSIDVGCRSPSIKSLPTFDNDRFVDATNSNRCNNRTEEKSNLIADLPTSKSVVGSEGLSKSNEDCLVQSDALNKDGGYDTLKLLAEEYNIGRRTLRESLREMPDLSLDDLEDNTMVEFEEVEKKNDETDHSSQSKTTANSDMLSSSSSSTTSSSSSSFHRRESRTLQISSHFHSQLINRRLVSKVTDQTVKFSHAKESLRKTLGYQGHFYSDHLTQTSEDPYFWIPERPISPPKQEGIHLIICVHGLDGNSTDLRLVRTYLEMSMSGKGKVDFLMSERNQSDTFSDFEVMTDRLVQEILYHIDLYSIKPARISFIGHSLGNIIIRSALGRKEMVPLLPKLHTFLSLSGPHLGMLFNNSGLVNMGIWLMQKWKKSTSLLQLSLKDHHDPRQTFVYRLSQKQGLKHFQNILLVGSQQDRYVPFHSSRIELCKAALRDTSGLGSIYTEMVTNLLRPLTDDSPSSNQIVPSFVRSTSSKQSTRSPSVFVRYDVSHALTSNTNNLIGRAAHIAVLDSELFIEKFITVSVLKYFL